MSLYKELLERAWETFSAFLIMLDNLSDVFGCSVIDFVLIMFGFFKVFGSWVIVLIDLLILCFSFL